MPDETLVAGPSAPPPTSSTRGDKIRFVVRGLGQTLITLGLVVLLFVVYEVWITNIFSRQENERIATKLEQTFQQKFKVEQGDDPTLQLPGSAASTIPVGTGLANIYMPRLGRDYHWTIVEGAGQTQLADGPGHYPDTQLPGQQGNFAVAGHRVGKGEPFLNIDKLRTGDPIIIETTAYWYVYRVLGARPGADPQGNDSPVPVRGHAPVAVPGREIVDPSAGQVLAPIPNHPEIPVGDAVERLLTLTTCTPKFTAAQRMIIHAKQVRRLPAVTDHGARKATMPAPVAALYTAGSS